MNPNLLDFRDVSFCRFHANASVPTAAKNLNVFHSFLVVKLRENTKANLSRMCELAGSLSHFRSTSRFMVESACLPFMTRMYSTVVLVVLNMKLAVVLSRLNVH